MMYMPAEVGHTKPTYHKDRKVPWYRLPQTLVLVDGEDTLGYVTSCRRPEEQLDTRAFLEDHISRLDCAASVPELSRHLVTSLGQVDTFRDIFSQYTDYLQHGRPLRVSDLELAALLLNGGCSTHAKTRRRYFVPNVKLVYNK